MIRIAAPKFTTWDRWDWIGAAIAAFIVAMWIAHIVLPAAPPVDAPDAPGLAAPGIGGPSPAFVR